MQDRTTLLDNSEFMSRSRTNTETWNSTEISRISSPLATSMVTDNLDKIYLKTTLPRNKSNENHARLVSSTSYGANVDWPLVDKLTRIGRRDDNDIQLHNSKISKYHAAVERIDDRYYVIDKKSSNGVKVNGNLILADTPVQLTDGDILFIGNVQLNFIDVLKEVAKKDDLVQIEDSLNLLKLVTILPSEQRFDESMKIKNELEAEQDDFKQVSEVESVNVLREDYEKLRLAYELSKVSVTNDITTLLTKSMVSFY